MDDETSSKKPRQLILLTSTNWSAWSEAVEFRALKYGSAGEALLKKEEPVFEKPMFNDIIGEGEVASRVYSRDALGNSMYMHDLKKVEDEEKEYHAKKREFLADLMEVLGEMDQKVKANTEFKDAYRGIDLLKVWEIIEFESTASGATSVYVDSSKLFKLEQGESFAKYVNTFRELVERLEKGRSKAELIKLLWNTKFYLGLRQEEFPTQLAQIYGKSVWPDYETSIMEFNQFKGTAEAMERLVKDNPDGKVTANSAKFNHGTSEKKSAAEGIAKRLCQNCGLEGHRAGWDGEQCIYIPAWCNNCDKFGHLPRFCLRAKGEFGRKEPAPRNGKSSKKWKAKQDEEGTSSENDEDEESHTKKKGGSKVKKGAKALFSQAAKAALAQQRVVDAHASKYVPWRREYISQSEAEDGNWSGEDAF
jgi:hypothetical protein